MSAVKRQVNETFNNDFAFNIWFPQLLTYSMVETLTGTYHTFGDIAEATLKMTALSLAKELKQEKVSAILKCMAALPPHSEGEQALYRI
jgi:2-haloacid dehalogenase